MRARVLLVTAAFLLLAVAPPAAAQANAPRLEVGDFWETETTTASTGVPAQPPSRAFMNVTSRETLVVDGVSYDTFRFETGTDRTIESAPGLSTRTVTETTVWASVSDGANVRITTNSTSTSTFPGIPPSSSTSETTYSPPCPHYAWPFEVGDAWSNECTGTTTTSGPTGPTTTTSTTNTTVRVLRAERVTVPAGSFDAFVLESTTSSDDSGEDGTTTTSWYSPEACASVKTTTTGQGIAVSSELISYRCSDEGPAPPAGTPTPPATPTPTATPTTTPAPTPGGTPAGTTAATATPSSTPPAPEGESSVPGPGAALVLAAAGVALLALRRRT